jgi:hypothetical protein
MVAHEFQHANHQVVWNGYKSELASLSSAAIDMPGEYVGTEKYMESFRDSRGGWKPEFTEKYPTVSKYYDRFDSRGRAHQQLVQEDGVSGYSIAYYQGGQFNRGLALNVQNNTAFNETLSEMSRIKIGGTLHPDRQKKTSYGHSDKSWDEISPQWKSLWQDVYEDSKVGRATWTREKKHFLPSDESLKSKYSPRMRG